MENYLIETDRRTLKNAISNFIEDCLVQKMTMVHIDDILDSLEEIGIQSSDEDVIDIMMNFMKHPFENDFFDIGVSNANRGFVYALVNDGMKTKDGDELVKVGMTKNDPVRRIRELSRATGVPGEFTPVMVMEVDNYQLVEKTIHRLKRDHRYNDRKEFFIVDNLNMFIDDFSSICRLSNGFDVTTEVMENLPKNRVKQPNPVKSSPIDDSDTIEFYCRKATLVQYNNGEIAMKEGSLIPLQVKKATHNESDNMMNKLNGLIQKSINSYLTHDGDMLLVINDWPMESVTIASSLAAGVTYRPKHFWKTNEGVRYDHWEMNMK